jgi:hypothetical protein
MSFSTDMDKALAPMASAHRADVKSAFTTFQTAVATEQTQYGTKSQEKIALESRLIDLARDLAAQIK